MRPPGAILTPGESLIATGNNLYNSVHGLCSGEKMHFDGCILCKLAYAKKYERICGCPSLLLDFHYFLCLVLYASSSIQVCGASGER